MRILSPQAVPTILRRGQSVFIQGGASEPTALLAALAATGSTCNGIDYHGVFVPGVNRADPASFGDGARWSGYFATRETAASLAAGRARLLPLGYGGILRHLASGPPIDVALIQVAPPDDAGRCSLGPTVDFVPTVLARSPLVIAELNPALPRLPGSPWVSTTEIDYAVEVDHPLAELARSAPDPTVSAVAAHAATLIDDGATLQTGIGRMPDAVLGALAGRNDLGFHSGMLTESALDLIERGVINGRRKALDRGLAVAGVALGSQPFYRRLADFPELRFRPADCTHGLGVLAQLDRLVAINGALEVDLFGQVNAERLAGRQISGIGGLLEFQRGARLAKHGRALTVLAATGNGGRESRIVPTVEVATCGRDLVDYVVTEHGVADLRFADTTERAERLIAVAAPPFRDGLRAAWRRLEAR